MIKDAYENVGLFFFQHSDGTISLQDRRKLMSWNIRLQQILFNSKFE